MAQPTTISAPPRPRRRPWRLALAMFVILIAGLAAGCWYLVWAEERDYQAALAETDQLDLGWRIADIEAARAIIPPEENAALMVAKAHNALTGSAWGGEGGLNDAENTLRLEKRIADPPHNQLLSAEHAATLRQFLDATRRAGDLARRLKDLPRGRVPMTRSWTRTHPLMQPLHVAPYLRLDALLAAQEDKGVEAAEILRASINNARSMGDEPNEMCFLVYVACMERLHGVLMRVLGQTTLTPSDLKTLQDTLQSEIAEPRYVRGLRGERAFFVEMDRGIRERRLTMPAPARRGWQAWLPSWLPASEPENRANRLRAMNEVVQNSRLPLEQQLDAVERIVAARQLPNPGVGWLLTDAVGEQARCQAMLHTMVLALAAERYRLAEGTWPKSAEELVRAGYAKAVPLDPFDGRPLRYKRLADGVMFHSIGPDRVDNGGVLSRMDYTSPGLDVGFRLWNPEARRQPYMKTP